jgi:AcrR family transcriptional regulator
VAEPLRLDRRQRRRQETIEEVLDVALDLMTEQGVGGLSIGEIARRMGIRPPSLYVYFPSKNALYDALFRRGATEILAVMQHSTGELTEASLEATLLRAANAFVRWSVEHPAYTQLLFWRPVPGFTPSEDAYAPAVELVELSRQRLVDLQRRGLLRDDVAVDEALRDWTALISGVISQQLSNAPDEGFDRGRFTAALPSLTAMFARYYASVPSTSTRRGRAHQRRPDR